MKCALTQILLSSWKFRREKFDKTSHWRRMQCAVCFSYHLVLLSSQSSFIYEKTQHLQVGAMGMIFTAFTFLYNNCVAYPLRLDTVDQMWHIRIKVPYIVSEFIKTTGWKNKQLKITGDQYPNWSKEQNQRLVCNYLEAIITVMIESFISTNNLLNATTTLATFVTVS